MVDGNEAAEAMLRTTEATSADRQRRLQEAEQREVRP